MLSLFRRSALASQRPTSWVNGSVCLSEVRLMRVCTELMNYSSTPQHLCRVEKNNYCSDATRVFFFFFYLPPANSCTHEHTSAQVVLLYVSGHWKVNGMPALLKKKLLPPPWAFLISLLLHTHTKQKVISILHFLHQRWGHNSPQHLDRPRRSFALTSGVKSSKRFVPPSKFLAAKLPACAKFTLLTSVLGSQMSSAAMKCRSSWMSFWLTQEKKNKNKKVDGRRRAEERESWLGYKHKNLPEHEA